MTRLGTLFGSFYGEAFRFKMLGVSKIPSTSPTLSHPLGKGEPRAISRIDKAKKPRVPYKHTRGSYMILQISLFYFSCSDLVGGEPHKLIQRHRAHILTDSRTYRNGTRLDLFVTDYEHIRYLFKLCFTDTVAHFFVAVIAGRSEAGVGEL